MKIKLILFKIINGFSNIKKQLANFECIHTEDLSLDEVKQSLCCYFHCGYRIMNLIRKLPQYHKVDIPNNYVKLGININDEFNDIYSFNKSLTHHSNKIYIWVSNLVKIILIHIVKLYIDGKG